MERDEDQNLPEPAAPGGPPARRTFTTQELEAVIRRAVELQAGSSARTEEGVSDGEVVRIGQELGFDPATVRRAMAEVRSLPPEERGALAAVVGARTVRAARIVRRPAAATGLLLEGYLREMELMVPQRRFPDRTRYLRDASLAAGLARFARGFSRSQKPLDLKQLDVAVSGVDDDACLVELSTDLGGTRGGLAAGVLGGGSAAAGAWAAVVWATPIVDPLMLLALPAVAGAWYGMRAIYGSVYGSIQDKLESLLDRLEHGELA